MQEQSKSCGIPAKKEIGLKASPVRWGGGRYKWQRPVRAGLWIQLSPEPQLFKKVHFTFWQPSVVGKLGFWTSHCTCYTSWRFSCLEKMIQSQLSKWLDKPWYWIYWLKQNQITKRPLHLDIKIRGRIGHPLPIFLNPGWLCFLGN